MLLKSKEVMINDKDLSFILKQSPIVSVIDVLHIEISTMEANPTEN